MPEEIECSNCGWRGNWEDLIIPVGCMVSVCPECEHAGGIATLDGVSDDDYRDQNPLEVPRE